MNDAIYAAPTADLSMPVKDAIDEAFYVVSQRKLAVLFALTFGLYQVYWHYKNWTLQKERALYADGAHKSIWPVARTIFAVFFMHALFREVREHAMEKGRPLDWNAGLHATILVLLTLASMVADKVSRLSDETNAGDVIVLLLLAPQYFCYRAAQTRVNASCGDAAGATNDSFTIANFIWITLGVIFWILVLIGIFGLPDAARANAGL